MVEILEGPEGRLARWAIKLQAYNYTIEHRAGSKHQNADGLSRLPTIHALIPEADRLYDLIHQPKEWDNEIPEIKQILGKLSENTTYSKGQLFKELDGKSYILLRPSNRPEVIKVAHLLLRHGGLVKTMEQIKKDYYWESISLDVTEYINSCLICQSEVRFKPSTTYELVKPKFAWHTVSMDLVGPLPPSTIGVKYIIVAIDHLTKWVEARSVKDLGARTVARFVQEQIIHRHDCPQFLLTDNATNFTGRVLPKLNYLMGIRGVLTTPYHPESNGTVERVNATLEMILRKLVVDKPSDWNNHLQSAVFAYNVSYYSSTKHTPFQLLYGRQPALPPLLYNLIKESEALSYYDYLKQLCNT